jgi:hypothetical protein
MTNQMIQIAQSLSKIKGAENSPHILTELNHRPSVENRKGVLDWNEQNEKMGVKILGPWLRPLMEDGKWSSASIREGLGLEVWYDREEKEWYGHSERPGKFLTLPLTDPAADEYAMILGIIAYWEFSDENKKIVEDYFETLNT